MIAEFIDLLKFKKILKKQGIKLSDEAIENWYSTANTLVSDLQEDKYGFFAPNGPFCRGDVTHISELLNDPPKEFTPKELKDKFTVEEISTIVQASDKLSNGCYLVFFSDLDILGDF